MVLRKVCFAGEEQAACRQIAKSLAVEGLVMVGAMGAI